MGAGNANGTVDLETSVRSTRRREMYRQGHERGFVWVGSRSNDDDGLVVCDMLLPVLLI